MKKIAIVIGILFILLLLERIVLAGLLIKLVLGLPDRALYRITHIQQPADASKLSEEECIANGGKWAKWGLAQQQFCQIPASDGGKTCFSGFQCQYGSCVDESNEPFVIGLGTCKTYQNSFGCYSQRHFGIGSPLICID